MINFDNAATTFPKPEQVTTAAARAISLYGGNPGRSGHALSLRAAEQIYNVRLAASELFGAQLENVVFTSNCTHALNIAIQGVVTPGSHVVISSLEHNSVARPVHALSLTDGVTYSVASPSFDDEVTAANFEKLITPRTSAVVCTLASNVTGQILPWRRIGEVCRRHGIAFIADGAQVCGIRPVKLSDGINILCTAGHKGLYGPTGTGLLMTDGKFPIKPLMQGGTGATSAQLTQTPFLPEQLESGTLNTVGIIALGEGIRFVKTTGFDAIERKEEALCALFVKLLRENKAIKVYRNPYCKYMPIVAFEHTDAPSEAVASYLSEKGFALRGGLQCAAVTHGAMGTTETGVVRFAPSVFNNTAQVRALISALQQFDAKKK
ncbi:MAG: aminotransferase class V-fold PLP-dependent enzyme [Oscillospiraceae bacterium]